MPRPAQLVPLLTWSPESSDEFRAKGLPLPELFATVQRGVWADPGSFSDATRRSVRRTAELARTLPPHPTPMNVLAWVTSLRGVYAYATAHLHWQTLRALYRYGAELGVSSGNPAARIPMRKPDAEPLPIANIDAVWPELLAVAETPREALWLGLLRFAGLRRGEGLGLRHDDVNTFKDPWRLEVVRQRPSPNDLHRTKLKTPSSSRELPVREPLRELLAPVLDLGEPIVRTGLGGGNRERVPYLCPLREEDLRRLGERCRAVLPEAFPRGSKMWHALRDTFALELHKKGKARSDVSHALGHSSEYTTSTHYLGVMGRSIRREVFDGLDPPTVERATAGASTPAVAGRSKAGSPVAKQESPRCGTHGQKPSGSSETLQTSSGRSKPRTQRALPGLALGPVSTRPRRR